MRKISISTILFSVFSLSLIILAGCHPMSHGARGQGYGTDYQTGYYGSNPEQGTPPRQGENWNYCPYCGQPFDTGSGYTMGPGMMGQGYGTMGQDHGMMGQNYGNESQYQQHHKLMEETDAAAIAENYLKSTRNPNLKLGSITDKGSSFEIEILTLDNSISDKIAIDKNSGWIRSVY